MAAESERSFRACCCTGVEPAGTRSAVNAVGGNAFHCEDEEWGRRHDNCCFCGADRCCDDYCLCNAPKNGSYLLLDVLWETEAGKTSSNPFYFSTQCDAASKGTNRKVSTNGSRLDGRSYG